MDIFSVPSDVLSPADFQKIKTGFVERIFQEWLITSTWNNMNYELRPCDLTIAYYRERQAVFVREWDAHNEYCDCSVCTRVRELLDWPEQELTPKNIWWTMTRLLPFDESGDRRIFLAQVAHHPSNHIITDPYVSPSHDNPQRESSLHVRLVGGKEIDLFTWRMRRNVTPKKQTPVWYLW